MVVGRVWECGGRWQCEAGCWVEAMGGVVVVESVAAVVSGGPSGAVAVRLGVTDGVVLPPNKATGMLARLA